MDRAATSNTVPRWRYLHLRFQQATSHHPTILHHSTVPDHHIFGTAGTSLSVYCMSGAGSRHSESVGNLLARGLVWHGLTEKTRRGRLESERRAGSLWTTVSKENVTLGYGNMSGYHGAGGIVRRFHDWVAENRRMLLAFGSKVQPKREAGTARGRVFGVWIKRFSLHGIISERGNTEGLTWSLVFLLACAQIKQRG